MAADKAEKSSKMPDKRLTRENSPESGEVIVPATPPRPAQLAGRSQGGNTITLALRTPERLRLGPDLAPRVTPPGETELAWLGNQGRNTVGYALLFGIVEIEIEVCNSEGRFRVAVSLYVINNGRSSTTKPNFG